MTEYQTTITNLAPSDLDIMSPDHSVATPVVPNGDGWRLISTTSSVHKIYYTWARGDDFTRKVVTSSPYMIQDADFYLGVQASDGDAGATLILPPGVENKRYVIKDERGAAASKPITICAADGETIDGEPVLVLNVNYGSVTLIYGTAWHVIGGTLTGEQVRV